MIIWVLLLQIVANSLAASWYEYYTSDGITSGLSVDQPAFQLNGKDIVILSGTMHYFRIPREYWRDRLKKLRAAGLNAVETYVPWNLHEIKNNTFDFGDGGTDFENFLHLEEYLRIAQEEDLFAIVRPGPFICAEWEWGGLPSWLLSEEEITVRTSDPVYMKYVERYFGVLLPKLVDLQFTKGGPIIAVQVENEYGGAPINDLDYIQALYDMMKNAGIVELLVTSDSAGSGTYGTIPEILFQTVNFGGNPQGNLDSLKNMQPGQPLMAMEFWTGWYDKWTDEHHYTTSEDFRAIYEGILSYPASANMYMFHGGSSFGFLNGANIGADDNSDYGAVTNSYDYDAPLSEAGDYTEKYEIVRELAIQYNPIEVETPEPPELVPRIAYDPIPMTEKLTWDHITGQITDLILTSDTIMSMEEIGQNFGYVVYTYSETDLPANSVLTITGHIRDTIIVLVNGVSLATTLETSEDLNGFGYNRMENSTITLTETDLTNATIEIVVENWGRANYGNIYKQYKGLTQANQVLLNGEELTGWLIRPLEFSTEFNSLLDGWIPVDDQYLPLTLHRGTLTIEGTPVDTFIDMRDWSKGIVIVNNFVLGRYAIIGPQQTMYLPGVFLKEGDNEIMVFEHFRAAPQITFSVDAIYETH